MLFNNIVIEVYFTVIEDGRLVWCYGGNWFIENYFNVIIVQCFDGVRDIGLVIVGFYCVMYSVGEWFVIDLV